MGWLAKLLPNHSLFGRIFIWFWMVTLILIAGTSWVARQVINDAELSPVTPETIQSFQSLATTVERHLILAMDDYASSTPELEESEYLTERLQQFAREKALPMMLIHVESRAPIYAMPQPMRARTELFTDFLDEQSPRRIQTLSADFVGPQTIAIDGENYAFFTGNPKPLGWVFNADNHSPMYLPIVVFFLSGVFCALLIWHLLKPIHALQKAANEMASGNLDARVPTDALRRDEIGQLGKDFNAMAEQIAQQVKAQKRLLADISHELRSPLARQQVAVDIAQRFNQANHSPRMESLITRIESENQRLNDMITELLQLSRLDAKASLSMQEVDGVGLLERLVKDAQFEAGSIQKQVLFLQPSEPLIIVGNAELLARAFENIIRNALKYANHKVQVSVQVGINGFTVSIRDDGTGVEPEELTELFKPFVRLSSSRDRKTGGVGLGLSIAAQAVEAHGGKIYASNAANGGLLVNIELPVAGRVAA